MKKKIEAAIDWLGNYTLEDVNAIVSHFYELNDNDKNGYLLDLFRHKCNLASVSELPVMPEFVEDIQQSFDLHLFGVAWCIFSGRGGKSINKEFPYIFRDKIKNSNEASIAWYFKNEGTPSVLRYNNLVNTFYETIESFVAQSKIKIEEDSEYFAQIDENTKPIKTTEIGANLLTIGQTI